MAKNILIRNPGDTSPFNKLEIHILKNLEKLLKGEQFKVDTDADMFKLSDIKKIYGLSKKEAMYVAALYVDNWNIIDAIPGIKHHSEKMDWSSIERVVVPEMKLYEVDFYQDVSASRVITFNVWGSSDDMADGASSADFYYNEETFTEMDEAEVVIGDYQDIYDVEIDIKENPEDIGDSLRENRKIIKKILNEYRRKI